MDHVRVSTPARKSTRLNFGISCRGPLGSNSPNRFPENRQLIPENAESIDVNGHSHLALAEVCKNGTLGRRSPTTPFTLAGVSSVSFASVNAPLKPNVRAARGM